MESQQLDFADDDTRTGFRLHRLEVLNWGTFDRHVWRIEPGGYNSLLTGDIGSGKSTLVDAVTTLLVPHQRIVYNKAAGAEVRERSLYSYVRGEYKSEKDELTQSARAVALRGENTYTVLLAWFHNAGFDQGATLAQVFWLKDGQRNPERFFVVAETPLSVAEHFSGFGSDILQLKRRLRGTAKVQVLDNFKEYATRFRHLFGIAQEQALELFYQTVSMKSVGNLTDFVRGHMLEPTQVEERIEELRKNFDNLNRAHEAVLKAKRQIEILTPLVGDGERYAELEQTIDRTRRCRDALDAYFAGHKASLLEQSIQALDLELAKLDHRLAELKLEIADRRRQEEDLKASIDAQGGGRIKSIEDEVARLAVERERCQARHAEYTAWTQHLELPAAADADAFYQNRQAAERLLHEAEQSLRESQTEQTDRAVDLRTVRGERDGLEREIQSLRRRRSNIPLSSLELRREMAETLGLDEEALPFAGELLQVDGVEGQWEGAIERLLHGFGLSLLVPESLYPQISRYVDRTHLRGRLVYFRVGKARTLPGLHTADPHALWRKLRIHSESPFYTWLESELAERFDHICCDNLEEFHRQPRAVTRAGQIKTGGKRHEKDDRRAIGDRSHYVLGWSNEAKLKALEAQARGLETKAQAVADALALVLKRVARLNARRDALRDLLGVHDFTQIDWQSPARRIQELNEEKRRIEESSDVLHSLQAQLRIVAGAIAKKEEKREELVKQRGRLDERRSSSATQLEEARALASRLHQQDRQNLIRLLDAARREVLGEAAPTLTSLVAGERQVREHLQARLDADANRSKRLGEKIVKAMQAYRTDYPAETLEVDDSLSALPEYAAMLEALVRQDLPRHEERFKQLLNEGTINSVALFQNQLDKESQDIQTKIRTINTSLKQIEYNPGTYIELAAEPTPDPEIRDFQQSLRQCLAHTLDQDALYTEQKFLQVKAIIERFNGREGLAELDRRWTRKVTDVRAWYVFSAAERWQEDGSVREFYTDSAGKSGGQKEKLAYTILASALAYQFGLEWNAVRSRSFRFVVIDEAFGRGSDESTRYGLELFKKLNLQLLIVTPLQKIHIIEDYIRAVHFVHNEDGRNSLIRNLTVEEYRAQKQQYLERASA